MQTIHLQTQQTVTAATASTGIDISSTTYGFVSGPTNYPPGTGFKLYVRIYGLDAGDVTDIAFESSTDSFSAVTQHAIFWNILGPLGATSTQAEYGDDEGESTGFYNDPLQLVVGLTDQNCSTIPWGESGAVLRINVKTLTTTGEGNPHITYESWFTF